MAGDDCPVCYGEDKECTACAGTGKKGDECPQCRGNGWLDDPSDGGTMCCDHCDSNGFLPPDTDAEDTE